VCPSCGSGVRSRHAIEQESTEMALVGNPKQQFLPNGSFKTGGMLVGDAVELTLYQVD
jgi:hypothetical protein